MTDESDVVGAWFDAFDQGDTERARALLATHARVHLPAGHVQTTLQGFDELIGWFDRRRASFDAFAYTLQWKQSHGPFVVVALSVAARTDRGEITWPQIAVYRVDDEQIQEIWLFEPEAAR